MTSLLARSVARGALVLAASACGTILGIEELSTDLSPAGPGDAAAPADGAAPGDAGAPLESGASPTDASQDAGPSKRVFVTKGQWNGALGGVAGGDRRCAEAATAEALGGTWKAFLGSGAARAVDRLAHAGAVVRLDGRLVVRTRAELAAGTLLVPIDVTEDGTSLLTLPDAQAPIDEDLRVWTGFGTGGQGSVTCGDWSTNFFNAFGTMGSLERILTFGWTDNGGPLPPTYRNWGCQTLARLYCFEQ